MKKILKIRIPFLLGFSMMLFITMFTACNNDDNEISGGNPVITNVRNYAASPNDTLVTSINPGQWIVIHGKNLKDAKGISFNGSPAEFSSGLFSAETAVLQVPSSLPFNNINPADLNTIKYVTSSGATTFKFNVNTPPATITGNSLSAANVVGDEIFIYGTNLYLIESLTIAGVDIAPLTTVDDGSSIGFILPQIDAPQPWEAVVVAASGTYTFNVSVEPLIYAVSYVNPSEGDLVRVYGKNLNGILSLSFGGAVITDYTEDPDGSSVEFLAPNKGSYAGGPVTIISTYGTVTTVYDVNNNGVTDGLLATFEWDATYFGYKWWQHLTIASNVTDFNGSMGTSTSQIGYFNTPILAPGDIKQAFFGSSDSGNYWIPVANLSDPVENWGLQFDISVANPWNGGTLYFQTDFAGESFVARYEPWKISASKTAAFETDGWQTVIIPLSQFKSEDTELGDGDSITNLAQLLGTTGSSDYAIYLKNFSSDDTKTGFYAGFDNIRVVKIK